LIRAAACQDQHREKTCKRASRIIAATMDSTWWYTEVNAAICELNDEKR
jgi:hypothetical protein